MVGGGGVNITGYSTMRSTLPVVRLSAVFDKCGNLVILLLTTEITVSHIVSAEFCCFIIKNSKPLQALFRAKGSVCSPPPVNPTLLSTTACSPFPVNPTLLLFFS